MIWPRVPRPAISRAAAWPTLKQPVTLTSRCACHCACETSRKGAASTMPALPIATSSGSTVASTSSIAGTVRDVHLPVGARACGADRRDPLGRLGFGNPVEHRHVRAAAGELERHRASEVPGCAGDRDSEPGEVHALSPSRHGRRRRERVRAPGGDSSLQLQGRPMCGLGRRLGAQFDGLARPEHPAVVPGLLA